MSKQKGLWRRVILAVAASLVMAPAAGVTRDRASLDDGKLPAEGELTERMATARAKLLEGLQVQGTQAQGTKLSQWYNWPNWPNHFRNYWRNF